MLSDLLLHLTGLNLFDDRLFRAGAASLFASLLVFLLMPRFIAWLHRMDATSDFEHGAARDLKQGKRRPPPILGGMLLVAAVLTASLCFTRLNAYSISTLVILAAYSAIGGVDDVMKIHNKR